MITLTHPDKATREAILATIQAVWADAPCAVCAAEDVPPGETAVKLAGPPQKLAALVRDLQTMHRQNQSPVLVHFNAADGARILNTRTREWHHGGDTQILTEKEVGVLLYLARQKTPVTREDLLRDIWQYAADADTHTIETHIYRLRQKIETDPANPVFLVTGKDGYQLAAKAIA